MTTSSPPPRLPTPGAATRPRSDRRRRPWLLVTGTALAVAAGVLFVLGSPPGGSTSRTGPPGPVLDQTNPAAVATVFLQRYAGHDPRVCELAAPALRIGLEREGRCGGHASALRPAVSVLAGPTICTDRASVGAGVHPPGQLAAPYAAVGLQRSGQDWTVRSVLPVVDRSLLQSFPCDTTTSSDGGSP